MTELTYIPSVPIEQTVLINFVDGLSAPRWTRSYTLSNLSEQGDDFAHNGHFLGINRLHIGVLGLKPDPVPVSYTHLDVYKRQASG